MSIRTTITPENRQKLEINMSNISLVQLRHFCAVAELGSIAEAARQYYVSATAISSAINALESTLNSSLCHRERARGVTLTPAGHLFYREAKRLVRLADDLVRTSSDAPDAESGPLKIGSFRPISPAILPPLIQHLEEERPGLKVEVTIGSVFEMVEMMLEGELHCFFSIDAFGPRGDPLPAGLVAETLYETDVYVLISAVHPLASRSSVSMGDLETEAMIVFESNPSRPYSRPLSKVYPGPHVKHTTTDLEVMRAMVARGLGYSLIIHPMSSAPVVRAAEIRKIPFEPPLPRTAVVLVRPEGAWQPPAAVQLIDLARRLVAQGELGAPIPG